MKITSISAFKKDLALVRPYTIARETISHVENVFLEITLENGVSGIGAANPSPQVVAEGPEQTLVNLQSGFIQELVGRDVRHFRKIIAETAKQFPELPGTLAAVDIALHDAFCKMLGVPVADFYGKHIERLPTSVTIGIKSVAATLAEAQEYFDLGFTVLKVKTGLRVDEDIERIAKLRERFGKYFTIRVDANQGYNLTTLKKFLKAAENLGVELTEQPLMVGSETGILSLKKKERQQLAADESLHDAVAALQLAHKPKPYGIYNIKLMKCGGILGALEIGNIARHAGIKLFWGCNDESIVSITAALHAAFACPNTRYLDLDGSLDLAEDLVSGGFLLKDGWMSLSGAPGLGVHRL